jgi:hypothetical protein
MQERERDSSPQTKYGEAKLQARQALRENHNPELDDFPKLRKLVTEAHSERVAGYLNTDVGLPDLQFLDGVEVLAHDRAIPAEVRNPPARLHSALSRRERRQQQNDRQRWMPATDEQLSELSDSQKVESEVISDRDITRGLKQIGLPPDQTRAVFAKRQGLDLQSTEAPKILGWRPERLESVRRSLEPDRKWGKALREHFAAYRRALNPSLWPLR